MDTETLRVAAETARWTYWSMIATSISAFSALATAIIAFLASRTWRKQERLNQLVRLKRATFDYRALVERVGLMDPNSLESSNFIKNEMTNALAVIFHELALVGLEDKSCKQGKLYNDLFSAHEEYRQRIGDWSSLFKASIELQKSIVVRL